MGFFKDVVESLYIAKCVGLLRDVCPSNAQYAELFCKENAKQLLKSRDEGFSLEGSVGLTCMMLLDSPDKKMKSTEGLGGISLIIASNFALASMARWPNSGVNSSFEEALMNFQQYINNDPIAKDMALMKSLVKPALA